MSAVSLQQVMAEAMQHLRNGALDSAKSLYAKVLQVEPENPDALHLYGLICHQQGDHQTAVRHIRRAVEAVPGQPVLRNNLGDALRKAGNLRGAAEQLRQALKLRPGYAGAHMNLGSVLAELGEHTDALAHSREAVRLDPDWAEAWFNLGMLQMDQVRLEESAQSLRKALSLRPTYRAAAHSLLYVLNLLPGVDPADVAEEHRRVAGGLFGAASPATTWPAPTERIRIGYVSGDFRAHAVNYFFEPILEHQDAQRFETFCYSDVKKPDRVTERLRGQAHHWREISGLSDAAVAERVRADRIDVLVDLAGYTEHGRLGVFAAKPSRCQISYLGYPNTTGLAAIDGRVVDRYTLPSDERPHGPESALRLPEVFACFRPPSHAPDVQAAPFATNGYTTFGSLHKLEKLNPLVVETWARILREDSSSRLLVARDQLDDWHRRRLEQQFSALGVAAGRLELVHLSDPTRSFFDAFSRIDILLDVFPWSGHTIACCALWSGVPVVSLKGNTHAGRMVASVLDALEHDALIAEDAEAYVRIAVDLSRDTQRLSLLRAALRERVEHSPLRDEVGVTRAFESACLELLTRPSGASTT